MNPCHSNTDSGYKDVGDVLALESATKLESASRLSGLPVETTRADRQTRTKVSQMTGNTVQKLFTAALTQRTRGHVGFRWGHEGVQQEEEQEEGRGTSPCCPPEGLSRGQNSRSATSV